MLAWPSRKSNGLEKALLYVANIQHKQGKFTLCTPGEVVITSLPLCFEFIICEAVQILEVACSIGMIIQPSQQSIILKEIHKNLQQASPPPKNNMETYY